MKPNVFVAVPAYRSSVSLGCTLSLIKLMEWFSKNQIQSSICAVDVNGIDQARNLLASMAMTDKQKTHVLFVDSDMSFKPSAAKKMLAMSKPVVGCAYPVRKKGQNEITFCFAAINGERYDQPHARVRQIGAGLLLISTDALRSLNVTRQDKNNIGHPGPIFGFFDRIYDKDIGLLPEDISFCRRWRDGGGDIHAILDEEIGHEGPFTQRAMFHSLVQSDAKPQSSTVPPIKLGCAP